MAALARKKESRARTWKRHHLSSADESPLRRHFVASASTSGDEISVGRIGVAAMVYYITAVRPRNRGGNLMTSMCVKCPLRSKAWWPCSIGDS